MAKIKVWRDKGVSPSPSSDSPISLPPSNSLYLMTTGYQDLAQSSENATNSRKTPAAAPLVTKRTENIVATIRSQAGDLVNTDNQQIGNSNCYQSLLLRQTKDVAAAQRFKVKLEKSGGFSSINVLPQPGLRCQADGTIVLTQMQPLSNYLGITKSRLTSARDSQSVMQKRKAMHRHRPTALQLPRESLLVPLEIRSAGLVSETMVQARSPLYELESENDQPLRRRRTVADFQRTKKSRRLVNVYQRDCGMPPLPSMWEAQLEQARNQESKLSPVTLTAVPSTTPTHESSDSSGHRGPQPLVSAFLTSENDNAPSHMQSNVAKPAETMDEILENIKPFIVPPSEASSPNPTTDLRKKRTLFGWFHRRSELEELIELYMDDVRTESPGSKRKPERSRLTGLWPIRNMTDPLQLKNVLRS